MGEERPLPVLLGRGRQAPEHDEVDGKKKIQNVLPVFDSMHSARSARSSRSEEAARSLRGPERLYYDKSTYTGTHKFGGPSTAGSAVGCGGYSDLSTLVQRDRVQNDSLQRRKRMSGADSVPTPPLAFTPRQQHRHSHSMTALVAQVDEEVAVQELQSSITYTVPAPRRVGPERFYYDKSTYTGTHKNGGPQSHGSAVGKEGYSDLSTLVVRSHVQDDSLQRRKSTAATNTNRLGSSLSLNALLSPRLEAHRLTFAPAY